MSKLTDKISTLNCNRHIGYCSEYLLAVFIGKSQCLLEDRNINICFDCNAVSL